MRFILLILSLPLFASMRENTMSILSGDPGQIIENAIVASSGDYIIADADIVVPGPEPLIVSRVYLSGPTKYMYSRWTIFPHAAISVTKHTIHGYDPEGSEFVLRRVGKYSNEYQFDITESGYYITNTTKGEVSSTTNITNTKAYLRGNSRVDIIGPDGSIRVYLGNKKGNFNLSYEIAPSKFVRRYDRDKNQQITRVSLLNPNRTKEYSWIQFVDDPNVNYLRYHTSAKTHGCYKYRYENGIKNYYAFTSNTKPDEKLTYDHGQVIKRERGESHHEKVHYYNTNAHDNKKVCALRRPTKPDGSYTNTQTFHYMIPVQHTATVRQPQTGKLIKRKQNKFDPATEVHHGKQKIDIYRFNPNHRFKSFERRDWNKKLNFKIYYDWTPDHPQPGNLTGKRFYEGKNLLYEHAYDYNSRNEVIAEHIHGAIQTDQEVRQHKHIRYTYYDGTKHLVATKAHDYLEHFRYLKGTNLLERHLLLDRKTKKIFQRTFNTYTGDHLLCQTIQDNGCQKEAQELKGVTHRIRTTITHTKNGLPQTITTYGLNDRLITKKHYTYTPFHKVQTIDIYDANDQLAYSLHYEYDSKQRCIKETDPLGRITTRTYTKDNTLATEKKAGERYTTIYTYDKAGRLSTTTKQGDDDISSTHIYQYDAYDNLIYEVDEYNIKTTYEPTPFGKPHTITTTSSSGETATSHHTYDSRNNTTQTITPENKTQTATYNFFNKPVKQNILEKPPTTTTYDLNNRPVRIETPQATIEQTYDHLGRPLTKTHNNILLEHNTYQGPHLITKELPKERTIHYTYDYAGRLATETEGQKQTHYSYDSLGNLQQETHLLNDTPITHKHYRHDKLGRLIHEWHIDTTQTITYDKQTLYDHADNIIGIITPTSHEEWRYDSCGRLTLHIDPLGQHTHHTYTKTKHHLHKDTIEIGGRHIHTIYAHTGDLLTQTTYDLAGNPTLKETRTYYRDNKPKTITYKTNTTVTYSFTYDTHSNLATLTENHNNTIRTTAFRYDPSGNLIEKIRPNNLRLTYTYDTFNHPTSITSNDNTINYSLTNDHLGNPLTATTPKHHITRTYDSHSNLLTETIDDTTIHFTYDPYDRKQTITYPDNKTATYHYTGEHLTAITYQNKTHTYDTYDIHTNVLSETRMDGTTVHYTYDQKNRPITLTSKTLTQKAHYTKDNLTSLTTNDTTTTYTYNSDNFLLTEESTTYTYNGHTRVQHIPRDSYNRALGPTYDALDRPIAHNNHTYDYDPFGRLISHNNQTYIFDEDTELGTATSYRIMGHHTVLYNDTVPQTNLLGDITHLHNLTGELLTTYAPTQFGENLPTNPQIPYIYRERRHTPFIHYPYRTYNPTTGEFLTPDPLAYTQGPNPHAYCLHNPTRYTDPTGLTVEKTYPMVPPEQSHSYENVTFNHELYCPYEASYHGQGNSHFGNLTQRYPNITFNEVVKDGIHYIVGFENGINTPIETAYSNAKYISDLSGRQTNVLLTYNQPRGGANDVFYESAINMFGFESKPVLMLKAVLRDMYRAFGDNYFYLHIGHSQGAIHIYNALDSDLTYNERKNVSVLTVAGARGVRENMAGHVANVVPKSPHPDIVTKIQHILDMPRAAYRARQRAKWGKVRFTEVDMEGVSGFLEAHSFQNEYYHKPLRGYLEMFYEKGYIE